MPEVPAVSGTVSRRLTPATLQAAVAAAFGQHGPIAKVLPGFEAAVWYGIFGPAGLPNDITNRLASEIAKALQSKELQDHFASIGAHPAWTTPQEFETIFREELVRQASVVKASGLSKQYE